MDMRPVKISFYVFQLQYNSKWLLYFTEKNTEAEKGKPTCPQKSYKCNKWHPKLNKVPIATTLSGSQKPGTH